MMTTKVFTSHLSMEVCVSVMRCVQFVMSMLYRELMFHLVVWVENYDMFDGLNSDHLYVGILFVLMSVGMFRSVRAVVYC